MVFTTSLVVLLVGTEHLLLMEQNRLPVKCTAGLPTVLAMTKRIATDIDSNLVL
jgi:hypothetical protein